MPYHFVEERANQWRISEAEGLTDYSYFASGISGQWSRHGASTSTWDDIYKNGAEVKSETIREKYDEAFQSTGFNRLTPDGIIVALGARLHVADTIGFLLKLEEEGAMKFLHLRLPAWNDDGQSAFLATATPARPSSSRSMTLCGRNGTRGKSSNRSAPSCIRTTSTLSICNSLRSAS